MILWVVETVEGGDLAVLEAIMQDDLETIIAPMRGSVETALDAVVVGGGLITGETEGGGAEEEVKVLVPRRSGPGAIAKAAAGAVPGAGVEAGAAVPVEDTVSVGRAAPAEATAAAAAAAAAMTGTRGLIGEVLSREILNLRSSQRWKVLSRKMPQHQHLQLQQNRNCFPWAPVKIALPFLEVIPMRRPRTVFNLILFLRSQSMNQQVDSSVFFAP